MLIIASKRSRKRSCLPEEGRVGRIAKTPDNQASEADFLQFPIVQTPWEPLKTKEFWGFQGELFLNMPEERAARFADHFTSAQCAIGKSETADYAVIIAGTPPPDNIHDDLATILIVVSPRELASVERHLAHGAAGTLTLPLRSQDIEAQLLLARQNRCLKQIRHQNIDRLEGSLRNRRHIERTVEIITRRSNVNRI